MNEKQRVIAGLEPAPARKYPIPTIFGELAKQISPTPMVHTAHEILMAIFRPKLSAMYGKTKNPISEPINSIDCRIVTMYS